MKEKQNSKNSKKDHKNFVKYLLMMCTKLLICSPVYAIFLTVKFRKILLTRYCHYLHRFIGRRIINEIFFSINKGVYIPQKLRKWKMEFCEIKKKKITKLLLKSSELNNSRGLYFRKRYYLVQKERWRRTDGQCLANGI